MSTVKIYLHEENKIDPRTIEIRQNVTHDELANGIGLADQDVEIFLDEIEEPLTRSAHPVQLKDRGNVHCHRCKKIQVTVSYNGRTTKPHSVVPSVKIGKMKLAAGNEFGISKEDLADLVLRHGNSNLSDNDHIGSFVAFPECRIHFDLINPRINEG